MRVADENARKSQRPGGTRFRVRAENDRGEDDRGPKNQRGVDRLPDGDRKSHAVRAKIKKYDGDRDKTTDFWARPDNRNDAARPTTRQHDDDDSTCTVFISYDGRTRAEIKNVARRRSRVRTDEEETAVTRRDGGGWEVSQSFDSCRGDLTRTGYGRRAFELRVQTIYLQVPIIFEL